MKNVLRHILATNIRNRRGLLGVSQVKLAEIADISPAYLAMIELEKKFPSDKVLERIAYALKIEPVELFSKTCFPIEAVITLHKAVLEDIEKAVKNQISKFDSKYLAAKP